MLSLLNIFPAKTVKTLSMTKCHKHSHNPNYNKLKTFDLLWVIHKNIFFFSIRCYVSLHWSKNKIETMYPGEVKTGLSLGQRLYFNSIGHAPAFLNQQLSSKFNTELCIHRLVVMYWYVCEGSVRQTGKRRNWRYRPQGKRIILFCLGIAGEKCGVSDKELFRLWERMAPADQHVLLKDSQQISS